MARLARLPRIIFRLSHSHKISSFVQGDGFAVGLAGSVDPANPADAILAVPATNYMEYSPSKETYTPRIYFTETTGGVIGANAMQGHNVIFDWERGRVGFAESTCEYIDESSGADDEDGEGGPASVDCRLGTPSLSVSCSDSADLSRCDVGGSAAASMEPLTGLEFWTRVVKSPGTPQGSSCEAVSLAENAANGGGKMEVNCDGRGVCREVRPCAISWRSSLSSHHYEEADQPEAEETRNPFVTSDQPSLVDQPADSADRATGSISRLLLRRSTRRGSMQFKIDITWYNTGKRISDASCFPLNAHAHVRKPINLMHESQWPQDGVAVLMHDTCQPPKSKLEE